MSGRLTEAEVLELKIKVSRRAMEKAQAKANESTDEYARNVHQGRADFWRQRVADLEALR